MNKESNKINIFELFVKYTSLVTASIAVMGLINTFVYFETFGINIIPFLTPSDLVQSFTEAIIPFIIVIIPFISLLVILFLFTDLNHKEEKEEESDSSKEHKPNKILNIISIINGIVFIPITCFIIINSLIFYFYDIWILILNNDIPSKFLLDIFEKYFYLDESKSFNEYFLFTFLQLTAPLYLFLLLFYIKNIEKLFRAIYIITFILSFFTIIARTKTIALLRKNNISTLNVSLVLDTETINTNDTLIYVKNISGYVIFYNTKNKTCNFIPSSRIKTFNTSVDNLNRIQIVNKLRKQKKLKPILTKKEYEKLMNKKP